MLRQRPFRDHAPPVPAVRAGAKPAPLIQGSWSAGYNRPGQRHAYLVTATSLALHLALGLLAALAVRPAIPVQEAAPPVEMVFEAEPLAPAPSPASATASERPAELPKTAPSDAPAEALPQPPLAENAVPRAAEPAGPSVLERRTPLAPPLVPPVQPPKPIASRRPASPRPAPVTAQQPVVPAMPTAPRSAATVPEAVADPSRGQPLAGLPALLAPAAPAAGASPAAVNGAWRGALAAWVQSRKRYPDEARRQGAEGQVAVRFTVSRDGQVLDAQVVRGSGSDLLDQAALSMFRGGRAPPFPIDMIQAQVTTTVSIRYRLQE
jgi:protein TonB